MNANAIITLAYTMSGWSLNSRFLEYKLNF